MGKVCQRYYKGAGLDNKILTFLIMQTPLIVGSTWNSSEDGATTVEQSLSLGEPSPIGAGYISFL